MDFSKITTQELAIYSNKLVTYIRDIDKALMKIDALKSLDSKLLFDTEKRGLDLIERTQKAQRLYNTIHLELEKRAQKKLRFSFDYAKMTKTLEDIDKAYFNHFNENKDK